MLIFNMYFVFDSFWLTKGKNRKKVEYVAIYVVNVMQLLWRCCEVCMYWDINRLTEAATEGVL